MQQTLSAAARFHMAGNIQGHWDYRKEWFFYGGGASQWSKGWQDYMGIELPLCYWEVNIYYQPPTTNYLQSTIC